MYWVRLTLLASVLLMIGSIAKGSAPVLNTVQPAGGQRGTQVQLTLSGDRLGDAQELLWYQEGIATIDLEPTDNKTVKATVEIAPDARLGLYDFRIRTATGISHLRTFSVGAFKEVTEVEPNNDFENPQPIELGVTVTGVAQTEDDDYFVVEVTKGQRISAEVEGIRLGKTLFDPYVAILNDRRFELSRSDDAPLVHQDGIAQVIAPDDGRYIIQVRESAYQGNGNCHYRLHVGSFPRPRATLPAGGPLGETIEVEWIGDVAGNRTEAITLPREPNPEFGLLATEGESVAPYPNEFRLSSFGNVIEAEPNASHEDATPFEAPMALNGVIGEAGDSDHFQFNAKKGQIFDVRVFGRSIRSPIDAVLWVAKKGGGNIGGNDDSNGPDSYYRFTAPEDGDYVIGIRDHLGKGGPTYVYRIEITPIQPVLTLRPQNENRQIGVITAAVPQGNRLALLLNAGRADFGGDLLLDAQDLPKGMHFDADTMAGNLGTMPILFTAEPEAPIAGSLASIEGNHSDPDTTIPSQFNHTVELVQGRNNIPFWTREVDRLAVAVAEAAPYSIDLVVPNVPIVRGGVMNLKVVATRAEGFSAPISVRLPWNPPGIGSSRSISIPEGQTEALIPINANGNAPLQTWKIVVNGYANGPSGPLVVSTDLTPLRVAERYLSLNFQRAAAEQGQETPLLVNFTHQSPFEGEAKVELIGLPNAVTTEPVMITKETDEVIFPIKIGSESPAGTHKNLFCRITIMENGEPVVHQIGSTELRIDKPLPKEEATPSGDSSVAKASAEEPAPKPTKPLSRLEQLRLEQQERNQSRQQAGGQEN